MDDSTARRRPRAWTVWVTGLALLGVALSVSPAGATHRHPTPNPNATAPGAPAITSVTPDELEISVAFTKPASDGGSPIFDYSATCTSSDGGVTGSRHGHWSPIRVHDLTMAKTYTCTVTARNHVGSGPPSAASTAAVVLPLVPPTPPGAPAITSATPGELSATVVFTAPANTGGARIRDYVATCTSSDGGVTGVSHHGRGLSIRVRHLTAGKTYTCTVTAKNLAGTGPPSAPSGSVVPTAPVPPTAPGAPTVTSVTAGPESVNVAFSKPASDGGSRIFLYLAACTSSDGGAAGSRHGFHSVIRVSHLTAGKTYTCTVTATNKVGSGPASAASLPVVALAHGANTH